MKLRDEINRYAEKVGYVPREVTIQKCSCGCDLFTLISDDEEGGAFATCRKCGSERDIQASRNYINTPVHNICTCDSSFLKLAIGVAYYENSNDARWVYVGGQCPDCELVGVYADWQER